jgi:hypothetical protein
MILNRRGLFSLLLWRPAQASPGSVRVLETFTRGGTTMAVLVNHADDASRKTFAEWLQARPSSVVRIRNNAGEETAASFFRVRMCFGRGFILFNKPITVREGDTLTIVV